MTTPFAFETIPRKEFFYDRENELKDLKSHIQNYTNVLLFSKRRMVDILPIAKARRF